MCVLQLWMFYVILATASAMIVSSPGLQRTRQSTTVTFIWVVNRTVTSFDLSKDYRLIPNPSRIVQKSEASFIYVAVPNVQLSDAGNYTLRVYFAGDPSPSIDTTACIYIYLPPTLALARIEGSANVSEGTSMTFSCSGASASLPAQYRPDPSNLAYSFFSYYIDSYGVLRKERNGSEGVPYNPNSGNVVDRYFFIDNQTLRINPIKGSDSSRIMYCGVCEKAKDGDICYTSNNIYITVISYRPFLINTVTPYRLYAVAIGKPVTFRVEYTANPAISSYLWSFSNSEMGPFIPLTTAWTTVRSFATDYEQLTFDITSSDQYGFYLLTLTNNQGTANGKFQVIAPGMPPDPPFLVMSRVTPSSVYIQWNSGWDNGRLQYFRLLINDLKQNTTIDQTVILDSPYNTYSSGINSYSTYPSNPSGSSYSVSDNYNFYPNYCYYYTHTRNSYYNYIYSSYTSHFNYTYSHITFRNTVYPETDYEVLLWAVNEFGSSEVVRVTATTPAYRPGRPKLVVSADSISISGNESVINFSVEGGPATSLMSIECYELNTMQYTYSGFNTIASTHQLNMTVPVGSKYQFVFEIFDQRSDATLLLYRSIQVPAEATQRSCEPLQSPDANTGSAVTGVIILAVILGIAVILGLVELVWILNHRSHSNEKNDSLNEISQVSTVSDKVKNEEAFYTSLANKTRESTTEGEYEDLQTSQ